MNPHSVHSRTQPFSFSGDTDNKPDSSPEKTGSGIVPCARRDISIVRDSVLGRSRMWECHYAGLMALVRQGRPIAYPIFKRGCAIYRKKFYASPPVLTRIIVIITQVYSMRHALLGRWAQKWCQESLNAKGGIPSQAELKLKPVEQYSRLQFWRICPIMKLDYPLLESGTQSRAWENREASDQTLVTLMNSWIKLDVVARSCARERTLPL